MVAVALAAVVAAQQVSPSYVRVTLAADGVSSGGFDQRVKLLFPRPGQPEPVLPAADDWYGSYCAIPEDQRPVMRTFTICDQDAGTGLIDIEFALHGDEGPASAWARTAGPGSTLGIIGPAPGDEVHALQYSPGWADWQLLVGDDTALPAITAILAALPPSAVARVFLQVPTPADIRDLPSPATDLQIHWTIRTGLAEAVRAFTDQPLGIPYAWVAGETFLVRGLRAYLVQEKGWNPRTNYFGGYWRAGRSEDGS